MTTVDLAQLVQRTRDLQRQYFRTRDYDVLKASKQAERDLDRAVDAILNPSGQQAIPGMPA